MFKQTHVVLLAGLVLLAAFSVNAATQQTDSKQAMQQQTSQQQESGNSQSADKNAADQASSREVKEVVGGGQRNYLLAAQMPSETLSSSLVGATVRNKAEEIGTVSNLILNKNYKLVGIVVDMSGITGLIQKSVGISWGAVKDVNLKKGIVEVAVSKSDLQAIRNYTSQSELQ